MTIRPMPSGRANGRERWILALTLVIPLGYLVVFTLWFDRIGIEDHDQHLVFHEMQFWNARLFGFAKQWSPVMCGGISLAADPQVPLLSTGMLLGYVLGPFYGLRMSTLFYLVVGWAGGWLYAGRLTEDRRVRSLAASLFIGNGFFVSRLCKGHVPLIPFLVLPIVLWTLHALTDFASRSRGFRRIFGLALAVLALGAGFALIIDGSPQVIIYFLPWVAVYAVVLSFTGRSVVPVLVTVAAIVVAAPLAAGYLVPMLEAQSEFPRLRGDAFTNPITLVWFLLLPVRGRILPAPGAGHEYSLFIGPILAWLIWTGRRTLLAGLPATISRPWLVTSVFAFVFGIGSLAAIGLPWFLSPFDLLRPLPGFRSIGITGRYWGFLALPLAMLAAMALARWIRESTDRRKLAWVMSAVLVLQLAFQVESVAEHLVQSERYRSVSYEKAFSEGPERIEYVRIGEDALQRAFITPTSGVIDCYNMGDFITGEMESGSEIVRSVDPVSAGGSTEVSVRGAFESWNAIRLHAAAPTDPADVVEIVLNQSYNRHWSTSSGDVVEGPSGNLVLRVAGSALDGAGVVLTFRDASSDRGLAIARRAWTLWSIAVAVAAIAALGWRPRQSAAAAAGR